MEHRRLSDLIHEALQVAVHQRRLQVAVHLRLAIEEVLSDFGGAGVTERRDVPDGLMETLEGFDKLRHERTNVSGDADQHSGG